jgi:23S rRNA pseudouridine1911/1915/1917 synthase
MAREQRHEWVAGDDDAGVRLDHFLTARAVLGTRSQIQRLLAAGGVLVNGRRVKAGTMLRRGDRVVAEGMASPPIHAAPEPIALDVLYEDEALLAINKPPGLVVHPAPGHWQGTLVSALLHRWTNPSEDLDPARLGIVHRLDKDTSGVLLIARTAAALVDLGRQFRAREVRKQYLALVWGAPRLPRGVVDAPIGRHPVQRKRMAVQARGRVARTRYEVCERFAEVSLLRAYPETGRTHQIRVHFASLGCPIVADALYARPRVTSAVAIARQALHAESIEFRHPRSGAPLCLEAPLAADFAETLADLRCKSLTSQGPFTSVRRGPTARHGVGKQPESGGRRPPS